MGRGRGRGERDEGREGRGGRERRGGSCVSTENPLQCCNTSCHLTVVLKE